MAYTRVLFPSQAREKILTGVNTLADAVRVRRSSTPLLLLYDGKLGVMKDLLPLLEQVARAGHSLAVVREAEAYLEGVAERARAAGVAQVETSVWYGPASDAIVEAARVRGIDLIVMSSHGRSGLGRLIFGSVAETVLRGTPILLIRPNGAPVEDISATGARAAEVSRV
jgi:nucleotide-binding universal stress UspA family protein